MHDEPDADMIPNATEPDASGNLASLLAAGGKVDPMSLLMATAGGQSGLDPTLLSLLTARRQDGAASPDLLQNLAYQMIEQRASAAPLSGEAEPPDEDQLRLEQEELERRRERLEEQRQRMRDLQQTLTSLYAEIETLRVRNDTLAAALGACYLCFGEDPLCPECSGNGEPGSLKPDAAAFRQYVVPALRRARSGRAYRPNGGPHTRKDGDGDRDNLAQQPSTDPPT
jgi:hypothetical protein